MREPGCGLGEESISRLMSCAAWGGGGDILHRWHEHSLLQRVSRATAMGKRTELEKTPPPLLSLIHQQRSILLFAKGGISEQAAFDTF